MLQKNNQTISLEKATAKDVDQYLAIEKSVIGPKTYSGITDENEAKEEFQNNQVFFIKKDGEIVGTIQYEIKSSDHAYLSGLAIDKRFQGQGIGREAVKLILNKLKNIKRIHIVTHPDNLAALKLYQSLGFIMESRKENYYGDGEPRLTLVLQK